MAFGMDPTIISTTPETQSSKKMSNSGNDLDKKPRKRQRIKRHRPKIRDESTPRKTPKSRIEPSTPKPKTPRRTIPTSSPHQKHVRKDSGKVDTSIYGDRQATDRSSGCAEKPCRRALRFNLENHLINQKDGEEAVTFTEEHNNYERKDDVKFLGFSLQNFDNRALFPNSDCATESCMNLVNEKSKIRARDSFGEMSRQAANPNPEQRESSCMDGNGKPKMVYSYQRRNKSLSTFSCKLDFNLNLEQQYFDSCSELEKIVHEYKSGEKRIHKSAYEGELNANSETENQNMCDVMKNEPGVDSNLQSCYRFGSLQVYQRIFKLNECLKNSRKLGPNCPSIYKKTRMQRRKATTFGGFWNATTVDQCQRKVNPSCRKEVSLSYGACRPINKTGKQRLFRRLTQKAMLERGKNIKRFSNTAISKSNFLVQLGQRGTKQKSEANKDPESFKWVLNSWKTWGCRRKRLFNRRQKLASSVVRLDMASQTKAVIVHPEFLGCALKSKRKRYNKFAEKIDLSSSGNHPFKSQSETTLSRAPTIGIQDFDDETFKYFVEVHNEDVHRRQRKSLYDVELSVGNLVSRHEDIQNSPMQCDDFVLGVQIYPPRQSLEIEMLKNQPAKDQSLETQNINEMGPFLHKTVSYCDNILECPLQCRNGLIEIPVCYQQREDIMLKSVQHQENVALDFEGKHQVPKDVSPIINGKFEKPHVLFLVA
ncbi:uncharacterized protein Fot_17551 [Forsythia ovata]|uniref:Uncharacterized protein n=1 Tax=Forsythia ovata TaxID=205694 RepID=A0ABD1VFP4_9LAMI